MVFHPDEDTAITASPDATVRVWHVPSAQTTQVIRAHEGPVTGLSLHATGDYLLSTSTDQHWAFSDLRTGRVLARVGDTCALTAAEFHPDGLILGTGTSDALVKIWDLKERTNVANFPGECKANDLEQWLLTTDSSGIPSGLAEATGDPTRRRVGRLRQQKGK